VAFVLDASATLPWCFTDEATAATDALQGRAIGGERMFVPAHWPAEILSGVTRAARRGRLDTPSVDAFLDGLSFLEIEVDARPFQRQWSEALPLVRKHRLSGYDAMYLALAARMGIKLASLDEQLRLAAIAEGVGLAI
jgi:predicted nucleic acid-binding protein